MKKLKKLKAKVVDISIPRLYQTREVFSCQNLKKT